MGWAGLGCAADVGLVAWLATRQPSWLAGWPENWLATCMFARTYARQCALACLPSCPFALVRLLVCCICSRPGSLRAFQLVSSQACTLASWHACRCARLHACTLARLLAGLCECDGWWGWLQGGSLCLVIANQKSWHDDQAAAGLLACWPAGLLACWPAGFLAGRPCHLAGGTVWFGLRATSLVQWSLD